MDCDMIALTENEVVGIEMTPRQDNVFQASAVVQQATSAEMTARQDNDFQNLVQQAASSDPEVQYQSMKQIYTLMPWDRSQNAIASILINSGILPILVHSLKDNSNPQLQAEAANVINKVAYGPTMNCHALVQAGAVPPLISLLSSPHSYLRDHALWPLANISGDEPPLKDYLISMGIAQPLLNLINADTPIGFLRRLGWIIRNLCGTSSPLSFLQEDILQAIIILVNHKDIEVLEIAIWALHDITRAGKEQTQMIIDAGVFLPKLVALLSHEDITVRSAALQAIGNIVLWTDAQTQAVLNCGALQNFRNLLTTQQSNETLSTAWVLSNIAAGTLTQIQEVIDAQLIPLIINKLEFSNKLDENEKFSTQFAWIVRNIVSNIGNDEQVSYLIRIGVLPPLCKLLTITAKSMILKGVVNDAARCLLFRIRAEEVEYARAQIAESIGPDKVDEFLQSIQCQGVPQNLQPIRRGYQEVVGGNFDDVFQNFQQMKLDSFDDVFQNFQQMKLNS